jgi:hypothetical protein
MWYAIEAVQVPMSLFCHAVGGWPEEIEVGFICSMKFELNVVVCATQMRI